MHVVIVAGGIGDGLPDPRLIGKADLVIAADGGAESLVALGIQPHVLIGDFDSVSTATRAQVEERGAEVIELRVDKDWTDTEVALRLALKRNATEVTVFGALGGPRIDHLLGNILLLTAPWLHGCDVRLLDARHEIFLARGDGSIAGYPGDLVSLLALSQVVEAVETEGLQFPLHREPLYQGATRGVSNELAAERARVRHGAGELLIIHYRPTEKSSYEV
jgi:thiamine pyrophosphokinase